LRNASRTKSRDHEKKRDTKKESKLLTIGGGRRGQKSFLVKGPIEVLNTGGNLRMDSRGDIVKPGLGPGNPEAGGGTGKIKFTLFQNEGYPSFKLELGSKKGGEEMNLSAGGKRWLGSNQSLGVSLSTREIGEEKNRHHFERKGEETDVITSDLQHTMQRERWKASTLHKKNPVPKNAFLVMIP